MSDSGHENGRVPFAKFLAWVSAVWYRMGISFRSRTEEHKKAKKLYQFLVFISNLVKKP